MAALVPDVVFAAALSLASAASAGASAAPAKPLRLSPEAAAAIGPLHEAYVRLEREQAQAPPPADEREKLERLLAVEQVGDMLRSLDLSRLPPDQEELAWEYATAEVEAHTVADVDALRTIAPAQGWFTISRYGANAVDRTISLVFSSGDLAWEKEVLARATPLVRRGEVDPDSYAALYDHVAVNEGRPERYGAFIRCTPKGYVAAAFKDERKLDLHRKRIGLLPEWEYLKTIPGCDGRTWRPSANADR